MITMVVIPPSNPPMMTGLFDFDLNGSEEVVVLTRAWLLSGLVICS